MANDSGIATALKLPKAIALSPLSRMLAAVNIEGNWRRFYGIQRPQPTDPSTATETYEYSEGSVELPGATTPGNVALVFTHSPQGLVDEYLKEKNGQSISLRFYTRGDLIHAPSIVTRVSRAVEATADGFDKGLSLLSFSTVSGTTLTDLAQPAINTLVNDGYIREGCVIQHVTDPKDMTPQGPATLAEVLDLTVVEQPIPDDAGNFKLYTKGGAVALGLALVNGNTDPARYNFEIYNPSTIWEVSGSLLTYSPQFDQAARAARIEITRNERVRQANPLRRFAESVHTSGVINPLAQGAKHAALYRVDGTGERCQFSDNQV